MAEKAEESKDVQAAVADGMDPEIAKEMEESGELPSAGEGTPENVEKPADGKKDADGDEPDEPDAGAAGGDDDGGTDDEDEPVTPNRPVESIPAWKAKEMAKEAAEKARAEAKAEFDAELKRIGTKEGGATDEDVSKLADEFGLQPDTARAFIDRAADAIGKRLGLDDIRKDNDERKEADKARIEAEGFNTEWNDTITQEALKAVAGESEITAEVRAKVRELAYSSTYARYRLSDIVRLEATTIFGEAPTASPTAERGRGGTARGTTTVKKDLDSVSPEDIDSMSDDEFDTFASDLGGGQSRFSKIVSKKGKS